MPCHSLYQKQLGLPVALEINLPHGVLHDLALPAPSPGKVQLSLVHSGSGPRFLLRASLLSCSCCSSCWEHTASHFQVRPRPYASEYLPRLPGACTMRDAAYATPTRLSLGDSSTGSAFCLPLCPCYFVYCLVRGRHSKQSLNPHCGHQRHLCKPLTAFSLSGAGEWTVRFILTQVSLVPHTRSFLSGMQLPR